MGSRSRDDKMVVGRQVHGGRLNHDKACWLLRLQWW